LLFIYLSFIYIFFLDFIFVFLPPLQNGGSDSRHRRPPVMLNPSYPNAATITALANTSTLSTALIGGGGVSNAATVLLPHLHRQSQGASRAADDQQGQQQQRHKSGGWHNWRRHFSSAAAASAAANDEDDENDDDRKRRRQRQRDEGGSFEAPRPCPRCRFEDEERAKNIDRCLYKIKLNLYIICFIIYYLY
jgi:hypothetical protein